MLILIGFFGRVWYLHRAAWLEDDAVHPVVLTAESNCDPALEICTVEHNKLTVALRLEGEVKPLVPFSIRLWLRGLSGADVDGVSVRFAMVGMDMGINSFELQRRAINVWQGQALLPLCSRGRRDWRIQVEMAGDRLYRAVFYTVVD